ncbi:iron chaperone [Hoeflea sp.]|uniref:iron chaperone n=1 Tax=Hoeflea sp. TaxID=1940281 RepID=UPI003B012B2B
MDRLNGPNRHTSFQECSNFRAVTGEKISRWWGLCVFSINEGPGSNLSSIRIVPSFDVKLAGCTGKSDLRALEIGLQPTDTPVMAKYADHDAYIAAVPEQFRAALAQLRAELARALPDAEEVIKYDMPGFQIEDTIIAGYAAFSKQCGLYVDPAAIAAHLDEIASLKLKASKTGVTFTMRNPVTDELVRNLAIASRREKGF